MAEAHDVQGALAAERNADFFPLNDLPNDVLVSVFEAVGDPTWVRRTFPLVCKAWNELYCSQNASPLHETLEVDFVKEVDRAAAAAAAAARERWWRRWPFVGAPRPPVVHASRVISWAQERVGSVRKLRLEGQFGGKFGNFEDFSAEDLGALVAVVGPSLTDIDIGSGLRELCKRPFWESLRISVVPAGRLRSFVVEKIDAESFGSDVETLLGQLAGSLEELALRTRLSGETRYFGDYAPLSARSRTGLQRFPESLFALEKLRRLELSGHPQITAIPAGISSLKKLEVFDLRYCELSSPLPKELAQLSGLTKLELTGNYDLRRTPVDEAFPAELGKMKSLRELGRCYLGTVPAFVGQLKSLESLGLGGNNLSSLPKELGELSGLTSLSLWNNSKLGNALPANEAFPAELGKMKCLRELCLSLCGLCTVPSFIGGLKSLEVLHLESNCSLQIDAPLDFLIEGFPHLRQVVLVKGPLAPPWTPESRAHLEAFEAKLLAKNPDAKVWWHVVVGSS